MKTYVFVIGINKRIAINANNMNEAKLAYIKILVEQEDLIIIGYADDKICEEDSITEVYSASEWL